jgi:hypothetical protein
MKMLIYLAKRTMQALTICKANCDKILTIPFNYYLTTNLFANHHIIVNRAILCAFINIKMVLDHTQTMNLRRLIVTLKRK